MTNAPTVAFVRDRAKTRELDALGARCDEKEIPIPADDRPADHWIAQTGAFIGHAPPVESDGSLGESIEVNVLGTVAAMVAGGRFFAILAPTENGRPANGRPALWVAADVSNVRARHDGTVGVFKKRPRVVEVHGDGWELLLKQVGKLDYFKRRAQAGQEASLFAALGG